MAPFVVGPAPACCSAWRVGGRLRACALSADGIRCWSGLQGAAELVPDTAGAQRVSVGDQTACGVFADAKIKCWGGGSAGATNVFGDGSFPAHPIPIGQAIGVVGGAHAGCALQSEGTLACWEKTGWTVAGLRDVRAILQLQERFCIVQDTLRCAHSVPAADGAGTFYEVDPTLAGASEYAGREPLCGVFPAGVRCSGTGAIAGTEGASKLTGGRKLTCALLRGDVQCWGEASLGRLGQQRIDSATPIVIPGLSGAIQLEAGSEHACVLLDGRVRCWGNNSGGVITPRAAQHDTPAQVRVAW